MPVQFVACLYAIFYSMIVIINVVVVVCCHCAHWAHGQAMGGSSTFTSSWVGTWQWWAKGLRMGAVTGKILSIL